MTTVKRKEAHVREIGNYLLEETKPFLRRCVVGQSVTSFNVVEYIRKDSVKDNAMAPFVDGMPYVIVRTCSAGVFAGYLKSRSGQEVVLLNARRIWYWIGAASLSQLAMEGTSSPKTCKFPCEVARVELLQAIEILYVTEKARLSIKEVPVWKA